LIPYNVNDNVVCIDASDILGNNASVHLKKDAIYRVTRIGPVGATRGIFVSVKGVDGYWYPARFRPLQEKPKETSIEVFKRMETPVTAKPKRVKEDA